MNTTQGGAESVHPALDLLEGRAALAHPIAAIADRVHTAFIGASVLRRGVDATADELARDRAADAAVAFVERATQGVDRLAGLLVDRVPFPAAVAAQAMALVERLRCAAGGSASMPTDDEVEGVTEYLHALANAVVDADRVREVRLRGEAAFGVLLNELARKRAAESAPARLPSATIAPDSSWLSCKRGKFLFDTPKQRRIVEVLFTPWRKGGDGCGLSEAAMLESDNTDGAAVFNAAAVRVRRTFKQTKNAALDSILVETAKGTWALYLDAPPPSAKPSSGRRH